MKIEELNSFRRFWDHILMAEKDIRENGHRGCPPPDTYTDPWDEDFAQAYEAIGPFLRRFRRKKFYAVPPDTPSCPVPYVAETAHQALMFFLNKPSDHYGFVKVLSSMEYIAIKEQAKAELNQLQEAREASRKRIPRNPRHKVMSDLALFVAALAQHHFPFDADPVSAPMTQAELKKKLNWTQSRISRRCSRWFRSKNGSKGMKVYRQLCGTGEILKGFLKKYDDGKFDVEAYFKKELETEDEDELEDDD